MAATRNVLLGVAVLTAAFVATPVDAQMARDARERSNSRDEAPAAVPEGQVPQCAAPTPR